MATSFISSNKKLIADRLLSEADGLKFENPKKALDLLEKSFETFSQKNPKLLGIKTQCLLNMGDYEKALEEARENCRLYNNALSHILLAKVFLGMKLIEKAYESAQRGAELSKGSDDYKKSLMFLGSIDRMIVDIIKIVKEATSYINKENNYKKALEVIEKALEISPYNVFAVDIKCRCLIERNDTEEALRIAKITAEKQKDSDFAFNILSQCYMMNGDIPAAIEAAEMCCKLGNHPKNITTLILAYCKGDFTEKAISIIKENVIDNTTLLRIGHLLRKERLYSISSEILKFANQDDPRILFCRAFNEMELGKIYDSFILLNKGLERSNGDENLKIRHACGILFLIEKTAKIFEKISSPGKEAVNFLKTLEPENVFEQQRKDYKNALKIAKDFYPEL